MASHTDWRIYCPTIQDKHLHLLNSTKLSDVIFLVGDTNERIRAHKSILIVASPVFETQFGDRWEHEDEIEIPDISPNAFRMFLEFLYADKFSVTESEAADVLFLAHKYLTILLAKKCFELLESVMNISNVIHIHQTAVKFNEDNLEKKAMEFILKNCSAVLESIGFLEIGTDTLARILKNDKLATDEINIFHAVMRWAENKCKAEKLDCTVENKRLMLRDLIPLIRFTLMSSEEFTNEVCIGKHEGILLDKESVAVFKHLNAGASMRSHLPRLPFNVNKRYNGFLYNVDIHEYGVGYIHSVRSVNCRTDLATHNPLAHCETTLGFCSSRNICLKGIELRRFRHFDSMYLVFKESGSPGTQPSDISAEISIAGTLHPEKRLRMSGAFLPSSSSNIEVESGFQIEKNVRYNIKLVVNGGGNPQLLPGIGMKLTNPVKVICQDEFVDFTFWKVSNECHQQEQPGHIHGCICSGQFKTIHFSV